MAYVINDIEIISSNNSINENKYNTQKLSRKPIYRLKKILKPLLKMLTASKKISNNISSRQKSSSYQYHIKMDRSYEMDADEFSWRSETEENSLNEELEAKLQQQIAECDPETAGIYVYPNGLNSNTGGMEIQPINNKKEEIFVPVCFARTEAGTFFWTTVHKNADEDLIAPIDCFSMYQQPEVQYCCAGGDRWGQA